MKLITTNKLQVDIWMQERFQLGHDLIAIKGTAPCGSTYSDGDLILQPINVAWKDMVTGEVLHIEYQQEGATP